MNINSKGQFYSLYKDLKLGNRVKLWTSLDELAKSGWQDTVTARYSMPGSKYTKYCIPIGEVCGYVREATKLGANPELFTFCENPNDKRILIQGEFCELPTGLFLMYSHVKKTMRPALAEQCLYAERSKANILLKYFLDENSLQDINILLESYPSHVIEFTCYDYELGEIPHRRVIIWEVRNF